MFAMMVMTYRVVEWFMGLPDPNFEQAIAIGTRSIAIKNPKKAVEILKNACESKRLKKNWQLAST